MARRLWSVAVLPTGYLHQCCVRNRNALCWPYSFSQAGAYL